MSTRREPAGLLVDVVGVEEMGVADEFSDEEFFDDATTPIEAEAKLMANCWNCEDHAAVREDSPRD